MARIYLLQPKFPGDENASDSQSRLKKQKRAEKPAAVSASDDARDDRQAPPKPPRKGKLSVEEPQEGALIEQGSEGDVVMDELKISQSTEKRDEYGPSYVVCKDTSDAKKSKEKKRVSIFSERFSSFQIFASLTGHCLLLNNFQHCKASVDNSVT